MTNYLLVDANNIASRSHHAMSRLSTTDGRLSGAIHGSILTITNAARTYNVSMQNVVLLWDGGRAKGRLELYPEYKGNRKKRENATEHEQQEMSAYQTQLISMWEHMRHIGCVSIRVEGTEADDLLSLFATALDNPESTCYILSGDKDFHQLATDRIRIVDPKNGLTALEKICTVWEVDKPATQIPFLKALQGDASDNIKGVPKIGEVRAKLVRQHICDYEHFCTKKVITSDKKAQKCLDAVYANEDVIHRNMKLMKLPRSWEESFYDEKVSDEAMNQCKPSKRDPVAFAKFLKSWELEKLLSELHNW